MATNIVVTGIPDHIKFPKLLTKFRVFFRNIDVRKFWIRNKEEVEGSQQVIVELISVADAKKARNYLNTQCLVHDKIEYPMVVHFENEAGHFENQDFKRGSRSTKRNRQRSRSPGYSSEASKLDMEIELLRKQRQVIEEERRLLVEQKKLEMIREFGPSAAREFDHFDEYEDEPPRKKRQLESVSKRPRQRSPPFAKVPKVVRPKGLPVFFQPCKRLIGQMKPYIAKGTTPEEVSILIKLIRAAIRKELAITLEGQAFIPTVEIIKLYREKHPIEKDEAFVSKILTNIRTSYLATDKNVEKDINLKEIKKEKASDNETDDAKVTKCNENETIDKATENDKNNTEDKENDTNDTKDKENDDKGKEMGDEVADNETAPKDTTNGENETDSAASVAVKTGPNTSQELENITAGNLTEEVNTEINKDDTSVPDATAGDARKGEDSVEDGNTEETKVQ